MVKLSIYLSSIISLIRDLICRMVTISSNCTGPVSNPGHIGGRRALSPMRHPCSPVPHSTNILHFIALFIIRLCESVQGVKELRMDSNRPHWVDMLIKCRLLGRNSKGTYCILCNVLFILRLQLIHYIY